MRRAGIDVGGTFTDLVLWDPGTGQLITHKVPSTPDDPAQAVISGLTELCGKSGIDPHEVGMVLHGTTIATNIVIERSGARVGMITTQGFRDVLHIARKKRPLNFSSYQDVPWQAQPLVPRQDRLPVPERVSTRTGKVLTELDEDAVRAAAAELRHRGVDAVAVCFLASFANPAHEERAAEIVHEELPGAFVCASSAVVPLYREYERFNTTVVNAYVGPRTARYLESLERMLAGHGVTRGLRVMTSSGGVIDAPTGRRLPVQLLMSGPAAGLIAGRDIGAQAGHPSVITLDVGGTSTDVGVAPAGRLRMKHLLDTQIRDQAVMVPMVDIETIGAGGGSVAAVTGGILSVGPRSVGAIPGPACYGHGGTEATATDAAAVLGWLRPEAFFGGNLTLDVTAARAAVAGRVAEPLGMSVEEAALGVHTVLANDMASSIRLLSERKGLDPRTFALVAIGGAGPLFGCEVARLTGIEQVIVPPHPGIGSAIGLLSTDVRYEHAATVWQRLSDLDAAVLDAELGRLERQAAAQLAADGVPEADRSFELACDCRYVGQGYELRVPVPRPPVDGTWAAAVSAAFHEAHAETYGRRFDSQQVQIVNVRVAGIGRTSQPAGAATATPHPAAADTQAQQALTTVTESVFRLDGKAQGCPTSVYQRNLLHPGARITGPAVIEQPDTTTVLPPGFAASVDTAGNLILAREGAAA
jgi:N-methylhydantoinase A